MDISEIHKLSEQALIQIESAKELPELEEIRVQFLGKKGKITSILHSVKDLSKEDKPKFGKEINIAKQKIIKAINSRKESLEAIELEKELQSEAIDVTLSGRNLKSGSLHPISHTIYEFADLFSEIGFDCSSLIRSSSDDSPFSVSVEMLSLESSSEIFLRLDDFVILLSIF